jgi:hypothetical protein
MQVTRSDLDHYIALIKMYVPPRPEDLILNMYKSGLSDWEVQQPKCVLVLSDADAARLHYPVDRQIRRQTFLRCVSASGNAYYPLLIAPCRQSRLAFDKDIQEGINVKIEVRDSLEIIAELFKRYV